MIRPVAWLGVLFQVALIALFAFLIARLFSVREPAAAFFFGALVHAVLYRITRAVFTAEHRRGISLFRTKKFSEAAPHFEASYQALLRRPWLDRFRWVLQAKKFWQVPWPRGSAAYRHPGAVDGDWGRKTQLATDAWQRSRGVIIPPWLTVAERELGIAEYPGEADNPLVVEYHRHTSLKASDDEVPWCSAFANYCMDVAGMPKTNSAAAASWLEWGHRVDGLMYGCVAVFSRTGGNHIAFVVGWDKRGNLAVLGGNQSDKVCVHARTTADLRGYRTI